MKITRVKQMERAIFRLQEILVQAQAEQNTADEVECLTILNNNSREIHQQLENLRINKNSPPALILLYLKEQIQNRSLDLFNATKFIIHNEREIEIIVSSSFLGFNLSYENYERANPRDQENWVNITHRRHHEPDQVSQILQRLNNLDNNFGSYLRERYGNPSSLSLFFYFTKSHADQDIIPKIWGDALIEFFNIINYCRNSQRQETI